LLAHLQYILNPERVYVAMVERFESSLDLLWYRCDNNTYPKNIKEFNEHRDPIEALAEDAVSLEIIASTKPFRKSVIKKDLMPSSGHTFNFSIFLPQGKSILSASGDKISVGRTAECDVKSKPVVLAGITSRFPFAAASVR